MEKKGLVLLVFVVVLGMVFGLRTPGLAGPSDIPLPNDINIVPPAADLPKELAAFSGKWEGTWTAGRETILIVEKIDEKEATVAYSTRDQHGKLISFRRTAKVTPGKRPALEFDGLTQGTTLYFKINEDLKSLVGEWAVTGRTRGPKTATITMKRME